MKRTLAALAATAACLLLAGCGSDGDDGDNGEKAEKAAPLTKDELIEQGDAICSSSNQKIADVAGTFADPENPTQEEVETAIEETVVPELESQLQALRALEPPAADADTIDGMLDQLEAGIGKVEDEPLILTTDDVFADANATAKSYGFTKCGES